MAPPMEGGSGAGPAELGRVRTIWGRGPRGPGPVERGAGRGLRAEVGGRQGGALLQGRGCQGGAGQAGGGAYGAWPELAGGSQADVTPAPRVLEHEPWVARPGRPLRPPPASSRLPAASSTIV